MGTLSLGTTCKRPGCCYRRSQKLKPPNNPPSTNESTGKDPFSPLKLPQGPSQEHPHCCDGADVPALLGGTKDYTAHTSIQRDRNHFTCFRTHCAALSYFMLGLSLREGLSKHWLLMSVPISKSVVWIPTPANILFLSKESSPISQITRQKPLTHTNLKSS